jgi:hypothetical protein
MGVSGARADRAVLVRLLIGSRVSGGAGPEEMQDKRHIGHVMQAAVHIHGGSHHAPFNHPGGMADPGKDHRRQQPGAEPPGQETGRSSREIPAGKRMALPLAKEGEKLVIH